MLAEAKQIGGSMARSTPIHVRVRVVRAIVLDLPCEGIAAQHIHVAPQEVVHPTLRIAGACRPSCITPMPTPAMPAPMNNTNTRAIHAGSGTRSSTTKGARKRVSRMMTFGADRASALVVMREMMRCSDGRHSTRDYCTRAPWWALPVRAHRHPDSAPSNTGSSSCS